MPARENVGSELYMSRDAREGRWSPKCDIFAFGLILYEMIYGNNPLDRATGSAEAFEYPLKPGLIPELEPLLRACLHDDPNYRPSADDILQTMPFAMKRR